ncbi:MAG TPA: DUF4097 family beta strand repeat-containing protein [Myxococcota bacterium]|nr:DUF4097 family beta strand repeat-containing protein [Myxococcota bacterium]
MGQDFTGREARSGRRTGGFAELLRSLLSGIPWSERAEACETLHFRRPSAGMIRIENANGRTRVIGEERDDVQIDAHKIARAESVEGAEKLVEEIQIASSGAGGALGLEVVIPGRWNRRGRVDMEVRVPRDLQVEVNSSNGKIAVCGLRGSVRVRSSNGGVRLDDVVGNAEISASNATVSCTCTQGRLVARSSNGKIELSRHRGSVDASTSNGLIHVNLEELSREGVQLATSNGRVVLELPEQVDGDVDLRVDNGVIRNQRTLCRCTRDTSGQVRGQLGAGGTPIRVRTSNGSISLR